jgi:hypothetical protein
MPINRVAISHSIPQCFYNIHQISRLLKVVFLFLSHVSIVSLFTAKQIGSPILATIGFFRRACGSHLSMSSAFFQILSLWKPIILFITGMNLSLRPHFIARSMLLHNSIYIYSLWLHIANKFIAG